VWGWNSHSQKWELGVLRDSRKFKARVQGSKHLALGCSLYHWKVLEVKMPKMASYEPFGHLQPKLWAKEGPGVKLVVWLPTIKSRESTRPRRLQKECDMVLKNFQRELQDCFKPHPNPRSEQEVMDAQSPGSPNRDSFKTPPWESREKVPFGCSLNVDNTIWGKVVASLESGLWWVKWVQVAHGLSQHQRCSRMWTNQLVVGFGCRIV
jgi:hypothetical protein